MAACSAAACGTITGRSDTVAIVDAYDDPTAESDLATYRAAYGLPACTTANGCFDKVNQNGATSPMPAGNGGWAQDANDTRVQDLNNRFIDGSRAGLGSPLVC